MGMDRKRVVMLRADGSRVIGQSYLLPLAEADGLIAKGAAKLPDEKKPEQVQHVVGPQQAKPAGPSETKPMAPVAVKAPVK